MSLGTQLSSFLRGVLRSPAARRIARDLGRSAIEAVQEQTGPKSSRRDDDRPAHKGEARSPLPSDHAALRDRPSMPPLNLSYSPNADGDADPGEIVWAWVPYEEDITRGKDRPVLALALEAARTGGSDGTGDVVVALMLTSRDRGTGTHTDSHGATWIDIGTGSWDSQGRASEVRADRLLRIPAASVRREGARLDQRRFDEVARRAGALHGWPVR